MRALAVGGHKLAFPTRTLAVGGHPLAFPTWGLVVGGYELLFPVRVAVDGVVRGTPPERAMAELRFPPQFSQLAVAVLAPGVWL